MAETPHKKPESHKPPAPKEAKEHATHEGHKHEASQEHAKADPAKTPTRKEPKAPVPKKGEKGAAKPAAKKAGPAKKGAAKAAPKKAVALKIVEKPTPKYEANPKPTLTPEQRAGLSLRRTISGRRPWFRRQQWYEYKKLADSGWRKPTGVDSAQRRHFGYEQSVVRIGFGGPRSVRGLHPSGFREVFVDEVDQLKALDVKTQAARVSGRLGARKLKVLYAEADKLGVRILNRKVLQ